MTTRYGHGVSNLLRRLPPSTTYSRYFTASRHLSEHDAEEIEYSRKRTDYDYGKPSYAARRNCTFRRSKRFIHTDTNRSTAVPAHIRHLMRSTPNPLTAIISRRQPPQQIPSDPFAPSEQQHSQPSAVKKNNDTNPHPQLAGLLVSSFNTVTLTPKPYVSFNIKLPSSTYVAIRASKEFTASGLKDAQVANAFVKRTATVGDFHGDSVWHGLADGDNGRLKEGKGGTWWMRCRFLEDKCVEVGDHVVVVGKVVECGGYEGGEGIGLVYAEGAYRKVGEVVDVEEEKGRH